MPPLDVWFAIPSANPENCRRVLPIWKSMGYKTAVLQNVERADIPADLCVWSDHYPGWAGSINILHRDVVPASASIMVSGGDDMLPDPNHTAIELAEQFIERFPDLFGVMQPHADTFMQARQYCGSPWLGRDFCRRMYRGAGPLFPGYRHNWADNELFWVSKCMGALWERPDLSHFHQHFTRTGEKPPEYWTRAVSNNDRHDVQLYVARSWQQFPGHEPLPGGGGVSTRFDRSIFDTHNLGLAEMYWLTRYGFAGVNGSAQQRVAGALLRCADARLLRVAIYGAGTHTRAAALALAQPPAGVRIVAIIDDNPALHNGTLWNFPIVSLQTASTLGLDAVVLSSNSMERELRVAAAPLETAGVRVLALYDDQAAPPAAGGRTPASPSVAA